MSVLKEEREIHFVNDFNRILDELNEIEFKKSWDGEIDFVDSGEMPIIKGLQLLSPTAIDKLTILINKFMDDQNFGDEVQE
ncbi:MAG TPA: hypothetical protein VFW11_00675 [Cyclobacteriaceae bacterium]|nr:hypothetical protein [Cyclobacteriaceae bacterium]